MKTILCAHLNHWPIDRHRREQRRRSPASPEALSTAPLLIVRGIADRQVIVALCDRAVEAGIRRGMTLTAARALCAHVAHAEYDPSRDARALEAMGRWLMRFTPTVALESGDGFHALFLDITGSERLLGSARQIVGRVRAALGQLQIAARVAAGPTPGAAWALAVKGTDGAVASLENLRSMLDPLPPIALRLSDECAALLHHLGLVSIGQLIDLPRHLLPARFGTELLLRIDQALGRLPETLLPLEHQAPVTARMDFDGRVTSLEALWAIFQQLIAQIITDLTRRGCGARRLDVQLLRFHAEPLHKSILLSRPSRDAVNLFNLFRCALEEIDRVRGNPNDETRIPESNPNEQIRSPKRRRRFLFSRDDDAYRGMILRVPVLEPLSDQQIALLGEGDYDSQLELDRLIERLLLRLGEEGMTRTHLSESHAPEEAWEKKRYGERHEGTKARRHEGKAEEACLPFSSSTSFLRSSVPSCLFSPDRSPPFPVPSLFFPQPDPIRVIVTPSDDAEGYPAAFSYQGELRTLVHVVGPERIGGRWWAGRDKTRDYFDVEDTTARRFWLFRVRETHRWFLHGEFE